ncbi:MAG TPA: carboxypeptidase-like regulatory domain-containing protein [Cyclobacteriaceae bacterium]|nr:carboxypeptidase-like regulatory domain-containing protein [Cyclobacteriaceae bacterium]
MKTMCTQINNVSRIGLMALFVFLASGVYAQHAEPRLVTVTGVVKSADDKSPMPNVNVWRKGSLNEGTVTDTNGRFTYPKPLAAGEILIFSFVGMERKEYVVPDDYQQGTVIDMGLDLNMISELVVTGEPRMVSAHKSNAGLFRKLRDAFK